MIAQRIFNDLSVTFSIKISLNYIIKAKFELNYA